MQTKQIRIQQTANPNRVQRKQRKSKSKERRVLSVLIICLLLSILIWLLSDDEKKPRIVNFLEVPQHYNIKSNQLIDVQNFEYLIQQQPCSAQVEALILVHTAPRNVEKRALIRSTWGGPLIIEEPLRLVFLLGAVGNDEQLQLALEQENALHGDMVQGSYQETYRNMTYKHVMALKWFHDHCSHAQLLVKVDDDIYVNTPQLLKSLLEPNSPNGLQALLQQRQDLMSCMFINRARVLRSYRSKWQVSFKEYADHYFPKFCRGFTVVYSRDMVHKLYYAAQHSPFFSLDDVHVTGLLAERINASHTNLKPYVLFAKTIKRLVNGQTDLSQVEFFTTWHTILPEQIKALWQLQSTSLV